MADAARDSLLELLDPLLDDSAGPRLDEGLDRILEYLDCTVGTIHVLDSVSGRLSLRAHKGLPPPVLQKVAEIPVGKGMAGLAAERREPVQICNLQQDQQVVRPDAKKTGAEGSIACPMFLDEQLVGVLGVAKRVPHDFSADEIELLMNVGRRLARATSPGS